VPRRGCRARRCRPAHGCWPGRRRAAPRTAPAAPRSAGPSPGRARSPRDQVSNTISRVERERYVVRRGRTQPEWAALGPQLGGTWGTAEDSRGQRIERSAAVSQRLTCAVKPLDWAFTRHRSAEAGCPPCPQGHPWSISCPTKSDTRDLRAVRLASAGGSRWWSSASESTSTGTSRARRTTSAAPCETG